MVGEVKSPLESNLTHARDAQRAQKYLVHTRTQGPTETETELCLVVFCGGMDQQWTAGGRSSGCSRPGYGISPLGGGCH